MEDINYRQRARSKRGQNMTRVFIELEFEANEVSEADVYNYLKELMENNCLDWHEEDN